MIPRLPVLAAILAASPVLAHAGDFASLAPIGFSADGRVFAFEQYGVQDGSGFPYATITFVDLDKDAFVAPSPVEVVDQADGATLAGARAEARKRAGPLLKKFAPERDPGYVAASNPPTEYSADPYHVAFRPRPFEPWPDEPVHVWLKRLPMAAPGSCGDETAGFALQRQNAKEQVPLVFHEDRSIPDSRNCPLDYAISAIVVGHIDSGRPRAVAMIGVKSLGFEGPDLRYIAQPLPLD